MKVCCLIVTYNRKELLGRCIEQCLAQDMLPDVLVFDNASSDGTEEYLQEKEYIGNNRICYYYSEKNLGGAGGFSNGLKMAIENGYDFVWMMDDDGYPRNQESLTECIKVYHSMEGLSLVNAFVYAENDKLSFKMGGCASIKDIEAKYGKNDIIPGVLAPFNGTLVSSEVVKKIGYPKAEFFIKGDEYEYVTRAKFNGVEWATAKKGIFYHPRFEVGKKKVFFKEISLNEEPAWKEYCRARNHAYISRTYYGRKALIKHYLVEIVKCFTYSTDRKRKIKATIQGLKDERNGIFSNESVMRFR